MTTVSRKSFLPPEFIKYYEHSGIDIETLEKAYQYPYKAPQFSKPGKPAVKPPAS